jgi:hypothetical protein
LQKTLDYDTQRVCGDETEKKEKKAYNKRRIFCEGYAGYLIGLGWQVYGWILAIIKQTRAVPGFHVRPWCWIFKRFFGCQPYI